MKQIDIILFKDDYEKIKVRFAVIRKKHNLTYLFDKSFENEDTFHHEWSSEKDFISIDYVNNIDSNGQKQMLEARITYKFELDSELYKDMIGLLYSVVSHINETEVSCSLVKGLVEIDLRAGFLSDMGIDIDEWNKYEQSKYNPVLMPEIRADFSESFIIKTLDAIKKGTFKGR